MEIVILETAEQVARRASDMVCRQLARKPDSVLGLATGSTPVALYAELIRRHHHGEVSFRAATTFNLDEYVDLPPTHPQSYRHFMDHVLFHHVDIDPSRTHVPRGDAPNPVQEGPAYEALIAAAGGIDLQILGIGTDGHVGFNEPTSSLASRTRIKTLTRQTVEDNSRFFSPEEEQPLLAITMGIATILEARRIVLMATGVNKAGAVAAAVEGPLSAMCPASCLQLHPKATVILDRPSASALRQTDYYDWVLRQQDEIARRHGDPR